MCVVGYNMASNAGILTTIASEVLKVHADNINGKKSSVLHKSRALFVCGEETDSSQIGHLFALCVLGVIWKGGHSQLMSVALKAP